MCVHVYVHVCVLCLCIHVCMNMHECCIMSECVCVYMCVHVRTLSQNQGPVGSIGCRLISETDHSQE